MEVRRGATISGNCRERDRGPMRPGGWQTLDSCSSTRAGGEGVPRAHTHPLRKPPLLLAWSPPCPATLDPSGGSHCKASTSNNPCSASRRGYGRTAPSQVPSTPPPSTNPRGRGRAWTPKRECRGPAGNPPRSGTSGTFSSLLLTPATRALVLRGTLVLISRIFRAGGLGGEEGPR